MAEVVRELLAAEKPDGSPDYKLRQQGMEAYLKQPGLFEAINEEDLAPHGVLMVLPVAPELRDREEGWAGTLPLGTTVRYPDGRCAVVREARDAYGGVVAGHFCLEALEPEQATDTGNRPPTA